MPEGTLVLGPAGTGPRRVIRSQVIRDEAALKSFKTDCEFCLVKNPWPAQRHFEAGEVSFGYGEWDSSMMDCVSVFRIIPILG